MMGLIGAVCGRKVCNEGYNGSDIYLYLRKLNNTTRINQYCKERRHEMPIVEEHADTFKFLVTSEILEFFNKNKIRTSEEYGVHRWSEGNIINSATDAELYTNTIFYSGDHITKLQSFSYSISPLNIWFSAGRYCSIADNVKVMGPRHGIEFVTSSEIIYRQDGLFSDTFRAFSAGEWDFLSTPQRFDVNVGHDVWIAQDVLLRGGISIGHGAVIAAGAVVVNDVEPYEIVGGVPAKRLRMRFDEHIVRELLSSQWWLYAIPEYPQAPWNNPLLLPTWLQTGVNNGEVKPFESKLGNLKGIINDLDRKRNLTGM